MSAFNLDVRPPRGYVHPNGVKRIKGVSFGTTALSVDGDGPTEDETALVRRGG